MKRWGKVSSPFIRNFKQSKLNLCVPIHEILNPGPVKRRSFDIGEKKNNFFIHVFSPFTDSENKIVKYKVGQKIYRVNNGRTGDKPFLQCKNQ